MSETSWGQGPTQFFYQLDGAAIFRALEVLGLRPTGTLMGLNSFENRVYELGVEPIEMETGALSEQLTPMSEQLASVVVKFYRPGRWSQPQIQDEHDFLFDLRRVEIPVISPLVFNHQSLHFDQLTGLYYVVFPRRGGRAPQDLDDERSLRLGRLIGRAHLVGRARIASHRLRYTPQSIGGSALKNIQEQNLVPEYVKAQLSSLVPTLLQQMELIWPTGLARIHGDLHPGNILERNQQLWILDFDDMGMGPAAQDFWMLLPDRQEQPEIWASFAEGYETFAVFPWEQLSLIPALRALRLLHFYGWVSKRWEDPAFPLAFGQYQSAQVWEELLFHLRDFSAKLS